MLRESYEGYDFQMAQSHAHCSPASAATHLMLTNTCHTHHLLTHTLICTNYNTHSSIFVFIIL